MEKDSFVGITKLMIKGWETKRFSVGSLKSERGLNYH